MSGNLDLAGFLLLGLLGSSSHCVAMCSPFVLLVSGRYARPAGSRSVLAAQSWYAAGRLTTYAALGALAGAVGGAFQFAGMLLGLQRAAAGLAGAALVASALIGLFSGPVSPHFGWINRFTRPLWGRLPGHPATAGLLLGLLPCGLVYTAVLAAVARGSALNGAAAMMVFGLGTVSALAGAAFANELVVRPRPWGARLAQVFVLVMGCWYLWRGLMA